jgi:hypothetical protein
LNEEQEHRPQSAGESPAEALARARKHARNAASESLAALRALLDAAALGLSSEPAEQHRVLATLARALDDLSERLSTGNTDVSSLILDALNSEIRRWEGRSQDEPEARAVLRAFLGMREILWELGIRSSGAQEPSSRSRADDPPAPRDKPPRVQRVEVQR